MKNNREYYIFDLSDNIVDNDKKAIETAKLIITQKLQ